MKYANKFFVCNDPEIYKCDEQGNWYVFRRGRWDNHNSGTGDRLPESIEMRGPNTVSEHSVLDDARKVALKNWMKSFRELVLRDADLGSFKESMFYQKGNENAPFWSESFLYCLLGKEDGRTLMSYLRRLEDISKVY